MLLLREVERCGPEASHREDGLVVAAVVLILPAPPEQEDDECHHEGEDGEPDGEADYEADWVDLLGGG